MERTLVLIKPDAIERGLSGEIITRFERKGLKIVGFKMMHLDEVILAEHYAHVVGRDFYAELAEFMSSSPLFAVCLEGLNAVEVVRKICGTDNFEFGTVRGDFCTSCQKNVVHSSDTIENAQAEIARFFKDGEIFDYDKNEWRNIYAQCDKK